MQKGITEEQLDEKNCLSERSSFGEERHFFIRQNTDLSHEGHEQLRTRGPPSVNDIMRADIGLERSSFPEIIIIKELIKNDGVYINRNFIMISSESYFC